MDELAHSMQMSTEIRPSMISEPPPLYYIPLVFQQEVYYNALNISLFLTSNSSRDVFLKCFSGGPSGLKAGSCGSSRSFSVQMSLPAECILSQHHFGDSRVVVAVLHLFV